MDVATLCLSSIFGTLSFLSCMCVALEAAADWREQGNNSKSVTRTQLFLQIPFSLVGLMFGLSILLSNYHSSVCVGNGNTCQLQGSLLYVGLLCGIGLDLLNSLTYLLMIKCQWTEKQFRKLGKWIHLCLWPPVLASAVYLFQRRAFQANASLCWILECDRYDVDCQQENQIIVLIRAACTIFGLFHLLFCSYAAYTV